MLMWKMCFTIIVLASLLRELSGVVQMWQGFMIPRVRERPAEHPVPSSNSLMHKIIDVANILIQFRSDN